MSICVESYRICCRCATVDLPDFVISDVRPSSDCHSVLNSFLRHFNINLAQSDISDVALIFSGRRLNIKDSVGAVFGSVPEPCVHVIIPLSSISAPKPQPPASLFVSPASAAEIQPRFTPPLRSSEPVAPPRVVPAVSSSGSDTAALNVAPSTVESFSAAAAAKTASLEAWASYYERVSFEWLQHWVVTRDQHALSSHQLAAQYARGCRLRLSDNSNNYDSPIATSHRSSQHTDADAPQFIQSSARAVADGTTVLAADHQRAAAAPQVELMPQAAAAQPPAANFVDPAPVNPVAGGGFGAGLLALIVRAAVTMYILSSSQPNGRMGWAVLACIVIYLINTDRLTFLLKLVYPPNRFFNALDPNAEAVVEPEWQHPGFVKGFLHLLIGFCVSIVPPPYAYADLN